MPMAPPPSAKPSLAEALHIEHKGIPCMVYMHCLWHCLRQRRRRHRTLPKATATAGASASAAYTTSTGTTTCNVAAP